MCSDHVFHIYSFFLYFWCLSLGIRFHCPMSDCKSYVYIADWSYSQVPICLQISACSVVHQFVSCSHAHTFTVLILLLFALLLQAWEWLKKQSPKHT
jgi:uncharacterized protein YybS (DUF2232 family)